jgi:MSHA pilin protein MshC
MSPELTAACPESRLAALCRSGQAGFTLVELVMVIVLLGILAVYAVPRILNSGDFYARGFHDQSMAYLRYAQKTAIAQRRTVCVTLSSNAISLRIANTAGSNTCSSALAGPAGEAGLSARSGVAFSGTPNSFNFDALGQPVNNTTGAVGATQTLQVANVSRSITIETVTGYVHE